MAEGYHKKGGQNPERPSTARPVHPRGSKTTRNAQLAKVIASRIMTGGLGRKADRLVMWNEVTNSGEAGWSEGPLAEFIQRILEEERVP